MTNSLIIAEGTGNQHKSIIQLIDDYKADFEEYWGQIHFSDLKTTNKFIDTPEHDNQSLSKSGRGRPMKIAWLNEPQATFLITLLRNNKIVVEFKKRLVREFYRMREILLNRQNEEWRAIRQAGKHGNKQMCAVIKQYLLPLAREQGYDKPDNLIYMNYNKAINKAAGVKPKSRDQQPLGQLYEIEKMQSIVEVSVKGLAARGDFYKQIYSDTNQTLKNYAQLSLIPQRFLEA